MCYSVEVHWKNVSGSYSLIMNVSGSYSLISVNTLHKYVTSVLISYLLIMYLVQ
jgi:beta-lactamase superfamily II metal-dependent hydrolase